jgi:hypothetical protein
MIAIVTPPSCELIEQLRELHKRELTAEESGGVAAIPLGLTRVACVWCACKRKVGCSALVSQRGRGAGRVTRSFTRLKNAVAAERGAPFVRHIRSERPPLS